MKLKVGTFGFAIETEVFIYTMRKGRTFIDMGQTKGLIL